MSRLPKTVKFGDADFGRAVMKSLAEGLYSLDANGLVSYVNPAAEKLFGWPKEELIGRKMHDLTHYKRRDGSLFPAADCAGLQVLQKGRVLIGQQDAFIRRDGRFFDVEYSAAPIKSGKTITGLVVVFRDISEQILTEGALRRREQELSDFFETASIGLHWVGPDGLILRVNQAELDLLGYRRDEYVGHDIRDFHEDRDVIEDILTRLHRHERLKDYPARMRCKDGSVKHVLIDSSVLWENGQFVHTRCFTRDVTDRRRWEISQAELGTIVESSADAIVGKDRDGRIVSWNSSAEELFGYTKAEAIGQPVTMLMPPDRVAEEADILAELKQGNRIKHYETVRRRKDGRLIDVSLSISPLTDAAGNVIGAAKIARDITSRKRAEAERESLLRREREARAEAEQASRLKDEFLATLSHELRTPIAAILGWAQVLIAEPDRDSARRAALAIERGAKTQAKLINDLLDVSRIITGKFDLHPQVVDFSPIVEAAMDIVRLMAESKRITLSYMVTAPRGTFVKGDAGRLQQAVWNLLTNAIKYTQAGGRVGVHLKGEGGQLALHVEDNGQGIRPGYLPFIFDRFTQSDGTSTRRHGGLGIGLSLVKGIVELHGGQVSAESAGEGRGSTFIIRLPTIRPADVQEVDLGGHLRQAPTLSLQGVRVLVVDDDREMVDLLDGILSKEGAEVRVSASARETLDLLETWHPQVLLCDISMPDMDGYGMIRQIRSRPAERGGRIPAVAVTAFARAEDRARALKAGYQRHIAKPFQMKDIVSAVAEFSRHGSVPGPGHEGPSA